MLRSCRRDSAVNAATPAAVVPEGMCRALEAAEKQRGGFSTAMHKPAWIKPGLGVVTFARLQLGRGLHVAAIDALAYLTSGGDCACDNTQTNKASLACVCTGSTAWALYDMQCCHLKIYMYIYYHLCVMRLSP